ncbi:MAG: efflux RND transporter periplasmic adaptor subunit [Pirellulaceae bacterium]|nr:efflux RND transporter periplasmic adaptor subunit [Pirellulaceae bacterium]
MIAKPLVAVVGLLAVALTGGGYWYNYLWKTPTELLLPGTVETQEVRLSSRVGGRVSKILVRESDLVSAGQPLVELEMPELDSQRSQLEAQQQAAEAVLARLKKGPRPEEIAAAAAAVQAAQARVDRMKRGFRSEEKEQARSEQESLNAELENALQDLNRERTLLGKGATTNAAYEAAVARHGRLLGQVNAAGAKLRMLEAGYRPEEVAETVAELARLQANLDLLNAGTRQEEIDEATARVAQLAAQIEEIDVKRRERTVFAPEPAVVEIISVRPGDIVAANQPVARVLRAGDLWVKAFISEVEMGRLRLGQKVEVTIDSFPNKRFAGEVTHISTTAEFTPRNVQTIDERRHQVFGFRVRVADAQGIFKSGMAASVLLPLK